MISKTVERISTSNMSHSQWLLERSKSIGGSDAAAIVGMSPWVTPYSLWCEKTGKTAPKEDNEAMRQGRDLEQYVADRWQEATGKKVRRLNAILKNAKYPWAHANIDREGVSENAGLECKTTSIMQLKKFKNGEYPEQYYAQCVHYMAVTDKPTLCNMTNHAYFNLDGHDAGTVENLTLQINADCVTEADPALIPTGRLLPQKGLAYDFTEEVRLGDVLARTPVDPVMRDAGGVDFNYCAGRDRETKLIATLRSPKTGRRMDVITDQPGVQCYTGQGLDHTGKGGVHYGPYAGVCLETQHYPDAIHQPHFESYVLRPQDKYDTFTIFRFTAE